MRRCLNLLFKYQCRSISEVYDKCSSTEWAELVYVSDINLHRYLNVCLELYIKELLEIQRENRWSWLMQYAQNIPSEVSEFKRLFAAQNIDLKCFCSDLYKLLMCVDPKKNCLRLIGAANSGKTLIAQLIAQEFVTGYVNNHNSENEFYLSTFLNKAICLAEELMITPATAEDFKSILGGATLEISKKYTAKQTLIRTPVIVTSNHAKFGRGHVSPVDEYALQLRCYTYQFIVPFKPNTRLSLAALCYLISVNQ